MARTPAAERARRLIALLGMLRDGESFAIGDLAQRVGASPAELTADLETLAICGIAPYSPDTLAPVLLDGDRVTIWGEMPAVRGAVRLSPREAEALVAALEAAGFSADDDLTRAIIRASAAPFDLDAIARTLRAGSAAHESGVFETLAQAAQDREAIAIAYQREGARTPTPRTVEPLQLFADRGAWYLWAWCRQAGDFRTFRIDRIRAVEPTGETFSADQEATRPAVALPTRGLPLATLRFAPDEPFVEREWPGGRVVSREDDGTTVVEVPFAGTDWVARRVAARLGTVVAVAPEQVRSAVAQLAREELA